MSITRQNLRRQMYDGRIPGLGFNGTADSVSATTITDAYALADTNLGTRQFQGMYIYRPDRTGDDKVRVAGTLNTSTGAIVHTGANWSNTSDVEYEMIGLMHPDELNACITRSTRRIYREVQLILPGLIVDGDMEAADMTHWAAVGSPSTREKSATYAFSGTQASHVANASANEGIKSDVMVITPDLKVYLSCGVRVISGTAKLVLYDETNSEEIASVTCAELSRSHLWLEATIPMTCKQITVRLLGVESDADIWWDRAALYPPDLRRFPAPSWLNEQYKFQKLREAQYTRHSAQTNQTYGSYDDADSRVWSDWRTPSDFSLEALHSDAVPYEVQITRPAPRNELWIQAKRPYSDTEPLDSDTAITYAPQDQLEAILKEEILRTLKDRYPENKKWEEMYTESKVDSSAELQARPAPPIQPERRREQPNGGRV